MKTLYLLFFLFFAGVPCFAQGVDGMGSIPEKSDLSKTITIYPNPATDYVNIKLNTLTASKVKITLYNILGSEIEIETEVLTDTNEVRVRVKELSIGYYLIAVREEQSQFRGTYKFLKR
jgi:hypothetical protein